MGETAARTRQCLLGDTTQLPSGGSVYYPYNTRNKQITKSDVECYFGTHGVDWEVYDMRTFECLWCIARTLLDPRRMLKKLVPC